MDKELFDTLKLLQRIIGQMSIADKVAFVIRIGARLEPDMMATSDGHKFTEENIISVTLGVLATDSLREFEAICGFYAGGYRSALRAGLYHGKGDIPNTLWRREIRRLYHNIKDNIGNMALPSVREFQYDLSDVFRADDLCCN